MGHTWPPEIAVSGGVFPGPRGSQLRWQVGGGRGEHSQCAQRGSVPIQDTLELGNIDRSVFVNSL